MSTRCTTHFVNGNNTAAIVYRHSDGYPDGAGKDIVKFFEECCKLRDSRIGDASYLAAKYVVFLAQMFAVDYVWNGDKYNDVPRENRLDFLSVGVVMQDPRDIDYRYVVDCSNIENGHPSLKCYRIGANGDVEVSLKADENEENEE
jgi:hypothetical protein